MSKDNVVQLFEKKEEKQETIESPKLKMDKAENVLELLEREEGTLEVPNGHEFLRQLRREARRQRDMKQAKNLMDQTLPVEFLPNNNTDSIAQEIALADSFEITEE